MKMKEPKKAKAPKVPKAPKQPKAPKTSPIEAEIKKKKRIRFLRTARSTIYSLIVVAAVAVLIATIWMPVLRIYGNSMSPTINEGNVVIALKGSSFKHGDVVGLYYGNKLLVKRVIAGPGQLVNIDKEGNVFVDSKQIDEPYLSEKAYGDVNIEFPYQVPDGKYFVMGDHRSTSSDSRNSSVGCISKDQIVGKIFFRVWPFSNFGPVK